MTQDCGLKIVFAGTPQFAAEHLKTLLENDKHQIVAVYTQPDRPAGRGKKLQASAVKQVAQQAGITVEQPKTLKDTDTQQTLKSYQADLMIVVAYGSLLPKAVLETPRLGCINVHASLLPRWRGAAPIQRAIEAGDSETGITIMQMDEGLDTGDMILKKSCTILPTDDSSALHDRLIEIGKPGLVEAVELLAQGKVTPTPQPEQGITYAHKLTKEEAQIRWEEPADTIAKKVRAFNPFPICYCSFNGDRLRVLEAEAIKSSSTEKPGQISEVSKSSITVNCASSTALKISRIQMPGKKAMAVKDALNGAAGIFTPGFEFN